MALVTYAVVAYRLNDLSDLIPQVLAYLLIVIATLNGKLSYQFRVFALMLAVYILAVAEFLLNGLNGDGRILVLTFVALTFYFFGIRWGFIAFLPSLATQLFLSFAIPQLFQSFLTGQTPPEIHKTVGLRMDGTTFPCEVFATQLHLPGEPTILVYLSDITDRKLSAEKLHFLSIHDSLTGLYNRAYFDHMLDLDADQIKVPVSILILDVNGLKKVNDTSGHGAGDALLQDTANVLLRAMRGEDTAAGIGGDEFVVVMPATDRDAVQKVVDRIQASIRTFNDNHTKRHPISIAIGCATLGANETWVDAVRRADEAMYIHKREKVL